jgi:hypothetical protein
MPLLLNKAALFDLREAFPTTKAWSIFLSRSSEILDPDRSLFIMPLGLDLSRPMLMLGSTLAGF